jgi:hypothetical protein
MGGEPVEGGRQTELIVRDTQRKRADWRRNVLWTGETGWKPIHPTLPNASSRWGAGFAASDGKNALFQSAYQALESMCNRLPSSLLVCLERRFPVLGLPNRPDSLHSQADAIPPGPSFRFRSALPAPRPVTLRNHNDEDGWGGSARRLLRETDFESTTILVIYYIYCMNRKTGISL